MSPKKDEYMRGYGDGFKDAAPAMLTAVKSLLAVFDEQSQIAQRIITGGPSDAELRRRGNEAIEALRTMLSKAS